MNFSKSSDSSFTFQAAISSIKRKVSKWNGDMGSNGNPKKENEILWQDNIEIFLLYLITW